MASLWKKQPLPRVHPVQLLSKGETITLAGKRGHFNVLEQAAAERMRVH